MDGAYIVGKCKRELSWYTLIKQSLHLVELASELFEQHHGLFTFNRREVI